MHLCRCVQWPHLTGRRFDVVSEVYCPNLPLKAGCLFPNLTQVLLQWSSDHCTIKRICWLPVSSVQPGVYSVGHSTTDLCGVRFLSVKLVAQIVALPKSFQIKRCETHPKEQNWEHLQIIGLKKKKNSAKFGLLPSSSRWFPVQWSVDCTYQSFARQFPHICSIPTVYVVNQHGV